MTFKDLHILQQLYLVNHYANDTVKFVFNKDDNIYLDKINDVEVAINDLLIPHPMVYVVRESDLDERKEDYVTVTFDVEHHNGLDTVAVSINRLTTDGFLTNDKFGLLSDFRIKDDVEIELKRMVDIMSAFSDTDETVLLGVETLNLLLETIPRIKALPSTFFESIKSDVGAALLLRHIDTVMRHEFLNTKTKQHRGTPVFKIGNDKEYVVTYQKTNVPCVSVIVGDIGSEVVVKLESSNGKVEGGRFTMTIEKEVEIFINSLINMLKTIVEESDHSDEYRPLMKRFLEYLIIGCKHIEK